MSRGREMMHRQWTVFEALRSRRRGLTVPAIVELIRLTTDGTMTAVTPVKQNDSLAEGIGATAAKPNSGEPTTGDVLRTWYVHPQTGLVAMFAPDARPVVGGGDRIGIQVTAPDVVSCNVYLVGIE